jgi:DNA-binding ferritin-like protein (Dps family)
MTEPEKKDMLKIFFVLCAVMTTITLVYFILIHPNRFTISSASPLFMLKYLFVFIDLVLIFFYFRFYFTKTNKFEELLNNDYRNTLDDIMREINDSYLTKHQKNEIKNDLLELLITSQESKRCVHQVVSDTGSFANDIIKSYGKQQWFLFSFLDGVLYFVIYILVVPYIFPFDRYIFYQSIFSNTSSLDSLLALGYIIFLFTFFLRNQNKIPQILFFLIPSIIYFLPVIFPTLLQPYNSFFFREVNPIPNIYVLLIYILIIPLTILLKKTIRNKTKIKLMSGD